MSIKCQCCNSEMNSFNSQMKKTFKCPKCGHVYWHWEKDEEYIKNYYDNYRKSMPTHKQVTTAMRTPWCENITNFVKNTIDLSNKKVLEIGAFDGLLSKTLINNFTNYEIHVNEYDSWACDNYLKDNFVNVFKCNFLDIEKNEFDALMAIDVLEHFQDVKFFHKKIIDLDINYLIIQVPDGRVRPVRENPNGFDPHYHLFTIQSIKKLFESTHKLLNHKHTMHNFSAKGPELLCIFEKL